MSRKSLSSSGSNPRDPVGIIGRLAPRRVLQPNIAAFIRANLPVSSVPSIPEIRLRLAGPKSGLGRLAKSDKDFGSPYWAHCWGGGLALARFLLDHPDRVAGRRVLDLGAGSGLVAIAAMKAGARATIAADIDPYAMTAIELNAAENAVAVSTLLGDPTAGAPPDVDLVAVGDLFYERTLAAHATDFLDRCLAAGIEALVGDPYRAFLPRARLHLLSEYSAPDFGDGEASASAVFSFTPDAGAP